MTIFFKMQNLSFCTLYVQICFQCLSIWQRHVLSLLLYCYFIFTPIFICCRNVFSSKCHFVVARRLPRLSILAAFLGGLFLLLVSDKKTEMMKKWNLKLCWWRHTQSVLINAISLFLFFPQSLPKSKTKAEILGNKKLRNSSSPRSSGKVTNLNKGQTVK